MKANTEKQKPFFAKFLEAQNTAKPGPDSKEQAQEEQWITKPRYDYEQTQKYPSDGDEI